MNYDSENKWRFLDYLYESCERVLKGGKDMKVQQMIDCLRWSLSEKFSEQTVWRNEVMVIWDYLHEKKEVAKES